MIALGWPLLLLVLASVAALLQVPSAALLLLGGTVLFAGFFLLSRGVAGPGGIWLLPIVVFAFLTAACCPRRCRRHSLRKDYRRGWHSDSIWERFSSKA